VPGCVAPECGPEAEIVKGGHESSVHVASEGKILTRETAAQERKAGPSAKSPGEHHHQ